MLWGLYCDHHLCLKLCQKAICSATLMRLSNIKMKIFHICSWRTSVLAFETTITTCKAEHKSSQPQNRSLQTGERCCTAAFRRIVPIHSQVQNKICSDCIESASLPLKTPVLCQTLVTEHHLFVVCIEMKC